ncbi:hypothetical protein ACIQYL_18275 [Lysinibacillus xylanilyticus]|uniref:hypothetical protein n=1 Tax=Lysinibacillus xylanilyticus TaxID=582475 RepID=UPI0038265591
MDLAKQLEELLGTTEEDYLMMGLMDIELNIEALKKGYYQKHFRTDLKRAWGFKCYHCGEKVKSDKDESYYIVSITWKDPNAIGRRFCSKECADIFYNESMQELLNERQQILDEMDRLQQYLQGYKSSK